ncbi:MAG: nuclear transport factor 2 family protein [Variovorax sp.]|nr:MAG: nuclear transport factor 2 family protein [Variovorax sp.]
MRTTEDVFAHHLQAFAQGLDALLSDYSEESSILLQSGPITGIPAIRRFFEAFLKDIKPGFWEAFKIHRQDVCAEMAYLVWEAKPFIAMATDTLLVRDGKIHVQTFTALG